MVYAISDIHGHYRELHRRLGQLGSLETVLNGPDRLILLGDYIDGGPDSFRTLELIFSLQQSCPERVIALRGNHEEMFLDWLDTYAGPAAREPDEYGLAPWSDWLDSDWDYCTFRTFLTGAQWDLFRQALPSMTPGTANREAAQLVLASHRSLIDWLRGLPYYYETETQIFVHAGVDEEAGEYWKWGTEDRYYTEKYPAATGRFYKDVIAGHVGTSWLAGDPDFHDVYWDGESHYYIDGTVKKSGALPVLAYDEGSGRYYALGPYHSAADSGEQLRIRGGLFPIAGPV